MKRLGEFGLYWWIDQYLPHNAVCESPKSARARPLIPTQLLVISQLHALGCVLFKLIDWGPTDASTIEVMHRLCIKLPSNWIKDDTFEEAAISTWQLCRPLNKNHPSTGRSVNGAHNDAFTCQNCGDLAS